MSGVAASRQANYREFSPGVAEVPVYHKVGSRRRRGAAQKGGAADAPKARLDLGERPIAAVGLGQDCTALHQAQREQQEEAVDRPAHGGWRPGRW